MSEKCPRIDLCTQRVSKTCHEYICTSKHWIQCEHAKAEAIRGKLLRRPREWKGKE